MVLIPVSLVILILKKNQRINQTIFQYLQEEFVKDLKKIKKNKYNEEIN